MARTAAARTTDRTPIVDTKDNEQVKRGNALVIQYLEEALATENALVSNLKAHISMTPRSRYRTILERHLNETQEQSRAIGERLQDLGATKNPVAQVTGFVETLIGQALVLTKGPLDMVRGHGGEEKLLKNAKDEASTEALEIATYDAIERVAENVGDTKTVQLARRHRAQEERMLEDLRDQIAILSDKVVLARVRDLDSFDPSTTGAADALRRVRDEVAERAEDARDKAAKGAGNARDKAAKGAGSARDKATGTVRRLPGADRAEGTARGTVAKSSDLPIGNYDDLNAGEVVDKLPGLSQIELSTIEAYERRHDNRTTVIDRIHALQGDEPFAGYDELTAREVVERVRKGDAKQAARVREYEQRHKRRVDVLSATQREIASK